MAAVEPVGLCGCGNMGAAIAARLAADHRLVLYDLDPHRAHTVAADTGAVAVPDLADLARRSRAVVLSLPAPSASRAVVTALVAHLPAGAVVVETSTVAPSDMQALAKICAPAGVRLLDAAVLSGVSQMAQGQATLLVGGDHDTLAAAAPVLRSLAANRRELGPLGSGMAAKIVNNAVSHAVMVVLLEAVAIGETAGLPAEVLAELLAQPDAGLLRPLAHRLRERVLHHDYDGGMPVELARKDSALALRVAHEAGVPLFAIAAAHTPYELAVSAGLGRRDYAALAQLWERWIGRSFQPERPDQPCDSP